MLITGGATGIGQALAVRFLARGNKVIVCEWRLEKLQEAQRKLPGLQVRRWDLTAALKN